MSMSNGKNHPPQPLLEVRDLHAGVEGKQILQGIDLTVLPGEVHAIMGPNGSGKSTLAKVLSGHEGFAVTHGEVRYDGRDLLALAPEERARQGVFLAFQYPVEIPGVSNAYFLRAALNAVRKHRGEEELDAMDFLVLVRERMKRLRMDPSMLNRAVNAGFSGGEKKRNEVLQMAVLQPRLALLDETDSGLDIDALKIVAEGVELSSLGEALARGDDADLTARLGTLVDGRGHALAARNSACSTTSCRTTCTCCTPDAS